MEKTLSEKMFWIECANRRGGIRNRKLSPHKAQGYQNHKRFYYKDVKKAVGKLKEEDEMFQMRIAGLVWGLCIKGQPFDLTFFNNRFHELLIQHQKNKDRIFGEFK